MDIVGDEGCCWQPGGRRGACCFSHNGAVYILDGYEGNFPSSVDSKLYRFILREGRWDTVMTTSTVRNCAVSGACCCVLGDGNYNYLMTFGGWKAGERVADLHTLDLNDFAWKKCSVINPAEGPFLKDKAGMIPYGNDMVCVIGGYGYPSQHHIWNGVYHGQKGAQYFWDNYHDLCWTNEVHLFHFPLGKWITPEMSGQRPPPCAAFSLTMADSCRAILFGGRQREMRVNSLYILHLDTWQWERVLGASPHELWPSARSFHTMCSLVSPSHVSEQVHSTSFSQTHTKRCDWLPCPPPDLLPCHPYPLLRPRLLLLWGMDNGGDPVPDCWMLELDPIAWKRVSIPPTEQCRPRLWHVCGACHPTPAEGEMVVFGGSKRNIFIEQHPNTHSVNDTVVLAFGVSTLYSLCMRYLSKLPKPVIEMFPSVLPKYIAQQIAEQATANTHYDNFSLLRL